MKPSLNPVLDSRDETASDSNNESATEAAAIVQSFPHPRATAQVCSRNYKAFIFLSPIFLSVFFHLSPSKAGHDKKMRGRKTDDSKLQHAVFHELG